MIVPFIVLDSYRSLAHIMTRYENRSTPAYGLCIQHNSECKIIYLHENIYSVSIEIVKNCKNTSIEKENLFFFCQIKLLVGLEDMIVRM